jgi:hypothetical protein
MSMRCFIMGFSDRFVARQEVHVSWTLLPERAWGVECFGSRRAEEHRFLASSIRAMHQK